MENRNLHNLRQGARGSLVMFNPERDQDVEPTKVKAGTVYNLGVVWQIYPATRSILLFVYTGPCISTSAAASVVPPFYSAPLDLPFPFGDEDPDLVPFLLSHHFECRRIYMGAHSFFL